MNELCLCCQEENDLYCVKRQLCRPCYFSLRKSNLLNEFPIVKSRLTTKKTAPEVFETYSRLLTDSSFTLTEISKIYGYTRERARQIFEKIFGYHDTVGRKKRSAVRHQKIKEMRMQRRDPRYKLEHWNLSPSCSIEKGITAEKKVLEICELYGYEVKAHNDGSIDLVINGFKVDVKVAYKTRITSKGGKTPLFHFQYSDVQLLNADFLVCYAEPINKFFIIPQRALTSGRSIYIPEKPIMSWKTCLGNVQERRSHWYQYLEAWNLLSPNTNAEVIFSRALAANPASDRLTTPEDSNQLRLREPAVQSPIGSGSISTRRH